MKRKDISSLIPVYPKACSIELLALRIGAVKRPYTEKSLKRGVRKAERALFWETLKNETLVERVLPMQKSTVVALLKEGCPKSDKEETEYISRDLRGKKNGKRNEKTAESCY